MKKIYFKLLICVMAVLALTAALVACDHSGGTAHFDHKVTFRYNVANEWNVKLEDQYIGVSDNSLVSIRPGYPGFGAQEVDGRYFDDWYLPKRDENGNVIKIKITTEDNEEIEDGRVELDRKWDFKNDKVTEDIVLYGNFIRSPKLLLVDIDEPEQILFEIDGEKPGKTMSKQLISNLMGSPKEGYTFLGTYYADPEGTEPRESFTMPNEFDEDGNPKDLKVYMRFVEGVYKLVYNHTDFTNGVAAQQNLYIMNDIDFGRYARNSSGNGKYWRDGDNYYAIDDPEHPMTPGAITYDLSSTSPSHWNNPLTSYGGEIVGNNFKLKNIIINKTANVNGQDDIGMFGLFTADKQTGKSCSIKDLTFENVQLNVTFHPTRTMLLKPNIGLLAGSIEQGGAITLSNVTISGKITVTCSAVNHKDDANIRALVGNQDDNFANNFDGCNFADIEIEIIEPAKA